MVRCTFSPARAWRLAVGPASTRTLDPTAHLRGTGSSERTSCTLSQIGAVCRSMSCCIDYHLQSTLVVHKIVPLRQPEPLMRIPSSVSAARLVIPAMTLILSVTSAAAFDLSRLSPITGSGPVVKELREVGNFQDVRLSTGARVVLRQGERVSVQVEAESNIAPLIGTYIEDGSLVIDDGRSFKSSSAEVVVTIVRIGSIRTTRSVAVLAEGLNTPTLTIAMGGSSVLNLRNLKVGKLNVALGGSSVLKANGTAEAFSSELGGSSALQATRLEAWAVSVSSGGSAQAAVWAKDSLRLSLGGSSGVTYYGTIVPVLATSGSATVRSLGVAPEGQQ